MENTATIFKALSEPVRVRMLLLLSSGTERCVCDLMAALDMPQSTVSRHLTYLRNARWITGRRGGKWMYYRVPGDIAGIRSDVLECLKRHESKSPQAVEDLARMEKHVEEKEKNDPCAG